LDTWLKGLPDSNRNDVVAELKQVAATFEYAASEARDDASFVGDLGNAGGILGGGTVAILIGSASPVAPIVIVCAALGGAVFVAGKMLKRRKERVANSDKLRAELSKQIANAKKD
jgi:hypothetical protein